MDARHPGTKAEEPSAGIDQEVDRHTREALDGQSFDQWMEQASTPPSSEEPAVEPASDSPQANAEEPAESTEVPYELKRGRVEAISGDDVFVKLGGVEQKLQGVVPLKQFERSPHIGSIMDFVVERRDESEGLIHLSREGAVSRATWRTLQKGTIVEARVVATNKGGLELEMIGGIRAFMPASQIDLRHVKELDPLVGQTLRAMVQQINRRNRTVVLSRKRQLEHARRAQRQQLLKELEEGQTREGTVTNIADFGAFVDLGGLDGMIHISDMSYSRIEKPSDVVAVGQTVTVRVLKIDHEQHRIRLGLKQVNPDPWDQIADKYPRDSIVEATVQHTTTFGAFVELEPGIEGLVHISELSDRRVAQVTDEVEVGRKYAFRVIEVNPESHRIKLSLKAAKDPPVVDDTASAQARAPAGAKSDSTRPTRPATAKSPPSSSPGTAASAPAKQRKKVDGLQGGLGAGGGMGKGLGELKL